VLLAANMERGGDAIDYVKPQNYDATRNIPDEILSEALLWFEVDVWESFFLYFRFLF